MTLSSTEKPYPHDHYPHWEPPREFDAFQESLVLSAYPKGSRIVETKTYRPGYIHYPIRVHVKHLDGKDEYCCFKIGRLIGGVEKSAKLLGVLARLGLPVPSVLAGPTVHPDYPNAGPMLVLSEMRGEPLRFVKATLDEMNLTCNLIQTAVKRLHQLTPKIQAEPIAAKLPRQILPGELEEIVARGGPWFAVPVFTQAVQRLRPLLENVNTPLVFTNGDYNPLNFLFEDGKLTAWLDFTSARFEDPHVGFAKFLIWGYDAFGWGPGIKAGLVERYLYAQDVSRSDFAPRLALRCLWRLQREISVCGHEDSVYRKAVLTVLQDSLASMG